MNIKEFKELFPIAKVAKKKKLPNDEYKAQVAARKRAAWKAKEDDMKRRFAELCRLNGIPEPKTEVCILQGSKLRWDFYFDHNGQRLAIELQGGIFVRSAHSTGVGLQRDYDKLNACIAYGVPCMMCSYQSLLKKITIKQIKQVLKIS